MRSSPGSESVRESQEIRLVDGIEDLHHRRLDDFVLQNGNAERPQATVLLGYEHPARRLGHATPEVDPAAQPLSGWQQDSRGTVATQPNRLRARPSPPEG